MTSLFLILLGGMFVGGIGFAYYLSQYMMMVHSSWKAHFLQWWPLVLGAVCMWSAGRFLESWSLWGELGTHLSVFVCGGVGYVVGRKLFF